MRELDLSGSLIAARRIGNAVHTVVADGDTPAPAYETWPADLEMCGTPEADGAREVREAQGRQRAQDPREDDDVPDACREKGVAQPLCDGLLRTAIRDGQAFTTVVSFDLADDKTPATTATLQSRPGAVFASGDALYLSVVHQKQSARRPLVLVLRIRPSTR